MSTITITGPVQRTRYLLARSTTFRAWIGVTTGAEVDQVIASVARIDLHVRRYPAQVDLPRAVVGLAHDEYQRQGEGGGQFIRRQTVAVRFWAVYQENPDAPGDAAETIVEKTADIVQDMLVLSGSADHIRFENCKRVSVTVVQDDSELVGDNLGPSADMIRVDYEFDGPQWGSQTETVY